MKHAPMWLSKRKSCRLLAQNLSTIALVQGLLLPGLMFALLVVKSRPETCSHSLKLSITPSLAAGNMQLGMTQTSFWPALPAAFQHHSSEETS